MGKDYFVTGEWDYICGKYLYPIAFIGGSFLLIIASIFLYFSSKDSFALIFLMGTIGIFLLFCKLLISQVYILKKLSIDENGVKQEDVLYRWSEVASVRQVFIFRIEFLIDKGLDKKIIATPIPFSMNNFNWPASSEVLEKLVAMKSKA